MYLPSSYIKKTESLLARIFLAIPFPKKLIKPASKISPLIAIYGLITSLPIIFILLLGSLGGFFISLFFGPVVIVITTLIVITTILTLYYQIKSIPELLKNKVEGWNDLFYGALLSFIPNILTGNIFGLFFGSILILYIIFHCKEEFSK